MPVLVIARSSGEEDNGMISKAMIVVGAFVAFACLMGFVIPRFRKDGFMRKWWKWVAQRLHSSPSPSPSPAMSRGGVAYPTSSPRKWRAWRKTNVDGEVYDGFRGVSAGPPPSPGAPSRHMRSVSTLSGVSDAGQTFPVVAFPPPAYAVRAPC